MHNGNWNDGMGHGSWWWIPMMIMMVAFWGGLIWIVLTLVKRSHADPQIHTPGAPPAPVKASAQEILAERLARGEIEPDDYRLRLETLRQHSLPPGGSAMLTDATPGSAGTTAAP